MTTLAARNRRFRIAAASVAAAWLVFAVRDAIEADHVFRAVVPGGYDVSAALFVAAHLVGACGLVAIATAFGEEVDRRRLLLGGAIFAAAFTAYCAAWAFRLVPALAEVHDADVRATVRWTTVAALLFAAGAWVAVSGFVVARRGPSRATRLWLGSILAAAWFAAITIAQLDQQSYYSGRHYAHE